MDRLAEISKDELGRQLHAEFEKTVAAVAEAVNGARDGHLINDSEERCRDVLGEFRRIAYEKAVQMRVEATEADPSFSPSGPGASRGGQPDDAQRLRPGSVASASLRGSTGWDGCAGG
jgi:hypothetical protein